MKIFIDDERMPLASDADGWVIIRSGRVAIDMIKANAPVVSLISFDNNLRGELDGDDVLKAIIGEDGQHSIPLPKLREIRIHTADTVMNRAMRNRAETAVRKGVLHPETVVINRSALWERYPMADLAQ